MTPPCQTLVEEVEIEDGAFFVVPRPLPPDEDRSAWPL